MSAKCSKNSSQLTDLGDETSRTGTLIQSNYILQNVTWTLKNLSRLDARSRYDSQSFCIGGRRNPEWTISIYPRGEEHHASFVSCYLKRHREIFKESEDDVKVNVSMTFRSIDGNPICNKTTTTNFAGNDRLGFEKMIRRDDLLRLIDEDTFVVDVMLRYRTSLKTSEDDAPPPSKFVSDLKSMLETGKYSDALVIDHGYVLPVHKALLCARSKVFAAKFEQDGKEKDSDLAVVDDLCPNTICRFLEFIYTGNIQVMNTEAAINLMDAAEKYQMEDLKAFCSSYLMMNLDDSNVVSILICANYHNNNVLKDKAVERVCRNETVINSEENEELLKKHPDLLMEIVKLLVKKKVQI